MRFIADSGNNQFISSTTESREKKINAKVSRSLIFRRERSFIRAEYFFDGERPVLSCVSNFSLGLYGRRAKVYFADESAKKLPYRRWYRKAAATSEYLTFAGFNQLSIVTQRDAIRHASQPIPRTRRSLYVRFCLSPDMKASFRSTTEIMFAHTSPSCRDLSTGPPPPPFLSARSSGWPSRRPLQPPLVWR